MNNTPTSADWQQLFGRRLRFLRTLENLTQGELAGRLGITVEHLSNMERGTSAPSFAMIIRLAEALGTEPANLFLFARGRNGVPAGASPGAEWTSYIAAVGSYEYVAHTGLTFWSDSLYRMLGFEPGEVEAGPEAFARMVHPDDRAIAAAAKSELLAGRDVPMLSFRVLRKDGRERFLLSHRAVERDASGRLLRLHGVVLDVTEQRLLQDSLRTMHANLEERVRERTRGLAETVHRLEEEVGRRTRAEAAARESESRLRTLGDNLARGAVFQLSEGEDGRHRLSFASAGLATLVGAGAWRGQPDLDAVLDAMHPEDRAGFLGDLEKCRCGQQTLCREVRFARSDGSPAWVRFQAACRDVEAGGRVCDGLALDITDLKRAEAERRLAVQRLQRAHELARIGHWEHDPETDESWWSDDMYRAFGYEPGARRTDLEFFLSHVHPDDREHVARDYAEALAAKRDIRCAFRIIRKDGSPGYGYGLARLVPGSEPGKLIWSGTYLDVTEHKAACQAIKADNERLKGLMSAVGLGAWVADGTTVRYDAVACRLLGLDPERCELPREEALALILPQDLGRVPDRSQPGPVEQPFSSLVRVRKAGGEVRRVLITGVLNRNPKGRATRAEGLVLDLEGLLPG